MEKQIGEGSYGKAGIRSDASEHDPLVCCKEHLMGHQPLWIFGGGQFGTCPARTCFRLQEDRRVVGSDTI